MKFTRSLLFALLLLLSAQHGQGQLNRNRAKTPDPDKISNEAVVVDRRLAVLRSLPGLYANPVQRLATGRKVTVTGQKEGDGVLFYEVTVSTGFKGWLQADAVVGTFRRNDDQRLAKLIQATDGFDQIEMAAVFLDVFADSPLRPSILLLSGDLVEEAAAELSKKAARSLVRHEMAASGAPLHSFYLNFSALDRYTKIGFRFLFNLNTLSYHYDGSAWLELTKEYASSFEAKEAEKRLESLKEKMAAQTAADPTQ